jgi:acyl-CoA reductase-like NAD-dependent aldehyde dehydrogenase
MAIFYNSGQACTAGSRLLLAEEIQDEFLDKLRERAKRMPPGDPLDPKTRLGPLVSREQLDRVTEYIEIGKAEGAVLWRRTRERR